MILKQGRPHRLARFVVLLGALALLLAGCRLGSGGQPSEMAADQALKMAWSSSMGLAGLDPALAQETSLIQISSLLFDGLVAVGPDQRVEPWDASAWSVSSDGLIYTFVLRPDLFFSDGVPVRPSDYAWSLDRALNTCAGSVVAYDLAAIKGATAFSGATCANGEPQGEITTLVGSSLLPDDSANTFKIVLERPAGYFLASLATPAGFAVERTLPTRPDATTPDRLLKAMASKPEGQGGGGMFYLAQWSSDAAISSSNLVLKPNRHWWGISAHKKPYFSAIDVSISASPFDLFLADPSIAFASPLPSRVLSLGPTELQKQPYYRTQPAAIITALVFNWKLAPFDDISARKAFCLAINRDQLNQQVYSGLNLPGWHLVPQGLPSYNAQVKGLDSAPTAGNATLAKQYWQQYLDAHGGSAPPIQISGYVSEPTSLAALTFYQQTWQQTLGVAVTPQLPGGLLKNPVPVPQVYPFGWSIDYPDPQDFLSLLYASDASNNLQGASVPGADTLMRQADALTDMNRRAPLYHQAEQLLIDDVAACPLFQTVNHYALRSWVRGNFVEDARGLIPDDAWTTGYIAKH